MPHELETYTLCLLVGDSDGTTEGLLFLTLVYAENRVYDFSLREQYSKGAECGLMKGKAKGSGRKANSLPGVWAQEECPGHVAGGCRVVFGCPCQRDSVATQS